MKIHLDVVRPRLPLGFADAALSKLEMHVLVMLEKGENGREKSHTIGVRQIRKITVFADETG